MSEIGDRQRPLRALYCEQPTEAISEKWARTGSATIAIDDAFHGEVEIGRGYGATFRYGLDRKVGGLHDLPNPGDLLCATLAACLDSTIRVVADILAIELEDLSVEASGEVDLRGTLLVDQDVPVGFRQMSCAVHVQPAQAPTRRRCGR